jgi:hypothetical protein
VKLRREVAQEERHVIVDRLRLHRVVVVQDQRELLGRGHELVDQGGHNALARLDISGTEQRKHALADASEGTIQRDNRVPPKPDRVVVLWIQRQPRDGPSRSCGPVGEQAGLAETGGRAHEGDLPGHPLVESLDQA